MTRSMLFDGWSEIARVMVLAASAYLAMVIALRISGKRTLAKLNAFDLVITVALGSVLATIALSSDVSLIEGVAAILLLVAAQWAVSWASVRTSLARRLTRAEASIVFADDVFDDTTLERERLTRGEVLQAIRASGCGDIELVAAVVLETDGSFSVIASAQSGDLTALPVSGSGTR